jgi:leucyl-tRNA synthetase
MQSTTYPHKEIEPKWQALWEEKRAFQAEINPQKPKFYCLDMFPYPSSNGLHVGHPVGYTASDIVARTKRAQGFNVLHPMGFDAFGLPAEQHAIKTGVHPAITTQKAMENYRKQLRALGLSFDWSKEVITCEPKYYQFTQWIFLKLYEKGLVYSTEIPVNWCPELKTVLANEEVIDGKSERGNHPVFRVPMRQWMLRITAYAERLLNDLETLDWPDKTKALQRNWIGKSEGLNVVFPIKGSSEGIEIFTTRADTIFGATFLVVAPEHPFIQTIQAPAPEVLAYVKQAQQKSEVARQENTGKTGVFSGSFVLHPFTKKPIPVWVADYVFMHYGTGAVMGVPAHDERDWEFAQKFHLPVVEVIQEGKLVASEAFTGQDSEQAKEAISQALINQGLAQKKTQYRLRDWLFSRQRYWGEPIPIVYDGKTPLPLKPEDLPVILPAIENFEPNEKGESPMAQATEWLTFKGLRRETDTMPVSAGSSWYFLRFCDPLNTQEPFSFESQKYWMPVDLYVGGPEHAVGHLLYARFWTKVLYDLGLVSYSEPFKRLVHQGMMLGEDGEKMSKSRGNVVNPDAIIQEYGADTLRVYEMFMSPLDREKPWSTQAIEGTYRFLQRVFRLQDFLSQEEPSLADWRMLHSSIKSVTKDIDTLHLNTCVSQMIIFVNHFTKNKAIHLDVLVPFLQILAPFAPHLAQELWTSLGQEGFIHDATWPSFDPTLAIEPTITLAVQINGKTRGTLEVERTISQEAAIELILQDSKLVAHAGGKPIKKVIFVPERLINLII